jgi:predicted membrane-bound spermidine synthase
MILLFLNSFSSFLFQSLIIKAASIRMQSDYLASSLILCILFLGLARGCRFSLKKSLMQQQRALVFLNITIPYLILLTACLVEMAPVLLNYLRPALIASGHPDDSGTYYIMAGLALLFFIGFSSGAELSCLYRIFAEKKPKAVVAISYFGALVAGLLASFYLFHQDDYLKYFCLLVLIHYGAAIFFLIRFPLAWWVRILACVSLFFGISFNWKIYQRTDLFKAVSRGVLYNRAKSTWSWLQNRDPQVETYQSVFQRIDIASFRYPKPYFQLYLNEDFQFDSADHELYHETFLKGGLHFAGEHSKPQKILILGGGDGLLADELYKTLGENIEITMVELDPLMTELAQTKWGDLNHHVFSRKIRLYHQDAFRFLRGQTEKFDAAFLDFPDPKSFDTSKLYSVEMFEMVKKVLNENGFLNLDFPYMDAQATLASTLKAAGFSNRIFYGRGHKFFYADTISAREDLSSLKMRSPYHVFPEPELHQNQVNSVFRPTLPASL